MNIAGCSSPLPQQINYNIVPLHQSATHTLPNNDGYDYIGGCSQDPRLGLSFKHYRGIIVGDLPVDWTKKQVVPKSDEIVTSKVEEVAG